MENRKELEIKFQNLFLKYIKSSYPNESDEFILMTAEKFNIIEKFLAYIEHLAILMENFLKIINGFMNLFKKD